MATSTKYQITSIIKETNNTVTFYNRSTVVASFSQLKRMPERDMPNGLYILLTDTEGDQFKFDVWNIVLVDTTTYTALAPVGATAFSNYQARINTIYEQLVTSVFKDCCCGDSPSGSGSYVIEYEFTDYAAGLGQFEYFEDVSDNFLTINKTSNLSQFLENIFHDLPNGAWISFYNVVNKSLYATFEISDYVDNLDGTITWTVVLIEGSTSFVSGVIYAFDYDRSGGSASQNWQNTLNVGSVLNTNNTVNAGSFDFTWDDVQDYAINSNGSISESVDLTATDNQIITDAMQLDTVTRQIIDYDTGDEGAHGSEILAGIINSFIRVRNEGESLEISFTVKKDGTYVRSALINAGTAVVGHPYVLLSATTGRADFGQIDTVGLKNGSVTYVKMQNVSATDRLLGRQTAGAGLVEEIVCTAAGRALIDDASASAQRTTLGIKQSIPLSGGNLGGTIAAGATVYFAPTVDATPGATETARCSVIAFSGTVVSFYYQTFATQPATGSLVLTFRRAIGMGAFASTSVVITIAAGSAAGIFSDVVNTATVAAGDRVSIQGVNNASTASASIGSWQIIIEQAY